MGLGYRSGRANGPAIAIRQGAAGGLQDLLCGSAAYQLRRPGERGPAKVIWPGGQLEAVTLHELDRRAREASVACAGG